VKKTTFKIFDKAFEKGARQLKFLLTMILAKLYGSSCAHIKSDVLYCHNHGKVQILHLLVC